MMPFGNFTLHCKALWSATRLQTRKTRCQQKAATLKTIFRFQQLRFSFHWWWVLFSLLSRHSQKRPPLLDASPKVPWPVGCLDGSGGYNTKKDEGTASFGWAWQFPILQRKTPVGWGLAFWSSMWFGFPRIHWTNPTPKTEARSSPSAKKKTKRQLCKGSNLRTWGQLDIDLDFPRWSSLQNPVGCSFSTQAQISESKIEVNVLTGFVISTSYATEKTSQHFLMNSSFTPPKTTPLHLKWPTCLKEIFKNLPNPKVQPHQNIQVEEWAWYKLRWRSIESNPGIPVTSDEVVSSSWFTRLGLVSFLGDGFSILDIF